MSLEAVRDARVMEFVFEQLDPGSVGNGMLRQKLIMSTKDPLLPEGDLAKSRGRDAQCELYVAAVCKKAGLAPAFLEPDIRCEVDQTPYGLAVKRTKNKGQLEKRIRKAIDQIDRSGAPGHIVLDVSVAYNRNNARLIAPNYHALDRLTSQRGQQFGNRYFEKIKAWSHGREVRSVILVSHVVAQHPQDGWGLHSSTYFIPLSPDNERRHREFEAFRKRFSRGLATPPDTAF